MRIAKASDEDITELIKWFQKKESRDVRVPCGWRRIVFGYITLFDNCADSTLSHLDFSPYLEGHVAPEQ